MPFIQWVVCLTTGPQPLPKPILRGVRSSASPFILQYPPVSLRSFNRCLHRLPRLPVTSILPSVFPSTMCFRRQFLHMMWPIQVALFHCNACSTFLSSFTQWNTCSYLTRSDHLIHPYPAQHFKPSQVFLIYFPKCPSFSSIQSCATSVALY
jgi:hypothetical protein